MISLQIFFIVINSLIVSEYLSTLLSNDADGNCENGSSFRKIISNLDYIQSGVKIWSTEEQQNFKLLGNDSYFNFSDSKNQELAHEYGESILTSIPLSIVTKLKSGFRSIGVQKEIHSFGRKFIGNECLKILVIGGSVTSFITRNGKLALGTESQTWPQKLETLLNYRYPNCTTDTPGNENDFANKHTVENLAVRAANSAHFCRSVITWRVDCQHVIHFADLIIIIDQVRNDDSLNAQYYEELLAILLKNSSYMSDPPALLWLGLTGWGSVLRKQVNLTRTHGFPMFHIPDTFIKNPHNLTDEMEDAMNAIELQELVVENQFHEFFIRRIYKGDVHGHLSGFAHSIIASFTLPVLEYLSFCAFNPQHALDKDVAVDDSGNALVPVHISKRVVEIFLEANPFLVSANNVHSKHMFKVLSGFEVAADQPGRAVGLLGYYVGDMLMLVVPDRVVARNLNFGFLTITYLASYTSMGVVQVAIAPREINHHTTTTTTTVVTRNISYYTIDCLWNKSYSVIDSVDIAITKEYFRIGNDGSKYYGMEINVTITAASPARSLNKIKIMDFTLY